MINILVVEDEHEYIEEITSMINLGAANTSIDYAKNKTDALQILQAKFFDLIILDLRIPIVDGGETDVSHGLQILNEAKVKQCPGTPVLVLTGSSAEEHLSEMINHFEKIDIWGAGVSLPTTGFHKKFELDSFSSLLNLYLNNLIEIHNVELVKPFKLGIEEDRLIRIFTRQRDGKKCVIKQVKGGLSGNKVYELIVTNSQGVELHNIICKIGLSSSIKMENDNYEKFIQRLDPHATPRKIAVLHHGAQRYSGIFYSLAKGFGSNLFDFVNNSHNASNLDALVRSIRTLTKPWGTNSETRKSIEEIRRRILWDETFNEIINSIGLDWIPAFEKNQLQTKCSCVHGDMHGMNILISEDNTPILIDYGDVGLAGASLDPITLELSLFFHPNGSLANAEWPNEHQAKNWYNLDVYLEGCPFPDFVRATRAWAFEVSAGPREVLAIAYAYVLRQWKFPNTNKKLILALLEGIQSTYIES